MSETKDELEFTEELFQFLQGKLPEGYSVPEVEVPRLSPGQAWTVIWYLGNQYRKVSDHIERCCVCGDLYDTWNAGSCLDYGDAPYNFCDSCMERDEFSQKMRSNPDANEREAFFRI